MHWRMSKMTENLYFSNFQIENYLKRTVNADYGLLTLNLFFYLYFRTKMNKEKETRMPSGEVAGKKPYECGVCEKSYSSQKALKSHVKCHGPKQYICNVCNVSFYKKSALCSHMKSHREERPYAWALCM